MFKSILILVVSWFVPGLGHLLQRKYVKGVVFLLSVAALVGMGLIMQGKFYDTRSLHPLLLLGFFSDVGNGVFFFAVKALGLDAGDIRALTYHYGTTYLACAGLLNYLIALNAFDIARGKRP
jgi:hypothetical protein